jgi:hypothetical protein
LLIGALTLEAPLITAPFAGAANTSEVPNKPSKSAATATVIFNFIYFP